VLESRFGNQGEVRAQSEENGTFTDIYHSDENRSTDLITRSKTIQNWRAKMGLPPGCNLE
jgi:hypothetical protein